MSTAAYGEEQITFQLTQSGGNLAGTLSFVGEAPLAPNNPVSGAVNGSSVTLSAVYGLLEDGAPSGDAVEYRYSGTLTGETLAGSVSLLFNGLEEEVAPFSVTRGGTASP